jgi:type VI secretion system secreted protein Hcp
MAQIYGFLKLDGIDGEAQDSDYENQIELQSMSWGVQNNSSFRYGTGSGIGQGDTLDITCTKYTDKASVNLMQYCTTGKPIESGELTLLKMTGDSKFAYLVSKLSNIVVTSWNISAVGDGNLPGEHFTLHFVKHETTYQPQSDTGDPSGSVSFSWDIQKNKQ